MKSQPIAQCDAPHRFEPLTPGGSAIGLRAVARSETRYRALLASADEHRRVAPDGRGRLSQAALVNGLAGPRGGGTEDRLNQI